MSHIETNRTTLEHYIQAAESHLTSLEGIARAWRTMPEERNMLTNTLPVAEEALRESIHGIVTCVSNLTRLTRTNAELTEAHLGFTEVINRLEPFIDSSIENDSTLNLTLLRVHTDLIAARQRLQDLDRVRTRPSHEPSEPIFHMGMEF